MLVCHEQGLLGNELIAIDGCKMPSNAAKEWSGTFDELGQKRNCLRLLLGVVHDGLRCKSFEGHGNVTVYKATPYRKVGLAA